MLVAAHQVFEDQCMIVDQGDVCVVDTIASTPDVPFGNLFKTRVRSVIIPTVISSEAKKPALGARLQMSFQLSWLVSKGPFLKPAIVSGARKGVQRNFEQLASLLERSLADQPRSSGQVRKERTLNRVEFCAAVDMMSLDPC